MVAQVILYGPPVLKKHSDLITNIEDIGAITKMLPDTLDNAGGTGLSAQQINLLKRIFIIDTSHIAGDEKQVVRFE